MDSNFVFEVTVCPQQGMKLRVRRRRAVEFHSFFWCLAIGCSQVPNTTHRTAALTPPRGRDRLASLRRARTFLHASTSNCGIRVKARNLLRSLPRGSTSNGGIRAGRKSQGIGFLLRQFGHGAARQVNQRTVGELMSLRRGRKGRLKWIGKPDSVMTFKRSHSDHSSCPVIARGVERPYPRIMGGPPNPPIWSCSGWGLPSVHHH